MSDWLAIAPGTWNPFIWVLFALGLAGIVLWAAGRGTRAKGTGALVTFAALLVASSMWISGTIVEGEHVELNQELPPSTNMKKGGLAPGRVVELNTDKGKIEFVLFEKDCPKTTARIAELVKEGCYDGVKFTRVVKDFVIQTAECKKKVKPMACEVLQNITHAKGAVGMAHQDKDYRSNTSEFYITLEPAPHLDGEFTVFGRVITGMDTALKIEKGDTIKSAALRPLTEQDKKRFWKVLQIESDRRTQ